MRQRANDQLRQRGDEDDAKGLKKGGDSDALFPFLPGGRRTELMTVIIVLLLFLLLTTMMSGESEEPNDDDMEPSPALLQAAHDNSVNAPGLPIPLHGQTKIGGQHPHQPGISNRYGRGRGVPIENHASGLTDPDVPPLDGANPTDPDDGIDPDPAPLENDAEPNQFEDDDRDPENPLMPPLDGDDDDYPRKRSHERARADGRHRGGLDPSLAIPGLDDRDYRHGDDDDVRGDLEMMEDLDREFGGRGRDGGGPDDDMMMDPDGGLDAEGEDDAERQEEEEMEREIAQMEKGMMGDDDGGALGEVLGDVENLIDKEGGDLGQLLESLEDGEFVHHKDSESEPDEMALEEMADLMFDEMDVAPKDNKVSWREWRASVSRDMPDFEEAEERGTFSTVDKNNDGFIDRAELREDWKREDLQFLSKDAFDDGPDPEEDMAQPGMPPSEGADSLSEPLLESNGPLRQSEQPEQMPGAPPEIDGAAPKSLGKTIVESALKMFKARAPKPHTLSVKLFQAKSATWAQAERKCGEEGKGLCPLQVVSQLRLCQDQDPHHRQMWTPLAEQDEWMELSTCNVNRMPESYKLQSLVACC